MGTQEEVLRLRTEVENQQAIDRLNEALERETRVLADLIEKQKLAGPSGAVFSQAIDQASHSIVQHRTELAALQKTQRDVGNASLQLSRGLEDLQYGFAGVVNNIPGMIQALGGTAGLTAAISLAFVAVNQLVNHWSDLKALFGENDPFKDGATSVEALTKRIDELNKTEVKLAVDRLELDAAEAQVKRIKEGLAAFEAAGKTKSRYEKESGSLVAETLAETPGGEAALRDEVRAQINREFVERSGEYQAAQAETDKHRAEAARLEAEIKQHAGDPEAVLGFEAQLKYERAQAEKAAEHARGVRARLNESAESATGNILKGAKEGDATAQGQLALYMDQAGYQGDAVRTVSPDELRRFDEYYAEEARGNEAAKMARELREMKKKDRDKEDRKKGAALKRGLDAEAQMNYHAYQKQEAAKKAAATKAETERKRQQHEATTEATKVFKQSGFEEEAEAYMLGRMGQGAARELAQAEVNRGMVGKVGRAAPGLDATTRDQVAAELATNAGNDLQRRQIALTARGVTGQAQAVQIMAGLNQELAQQGRKLDAVDATLRQIARSSSARMRTAASRGR